MKYVLVSLVLLLVPVVNAHRLLGFWIPESEDHVPIEKHLSGNALRNLETAVDKVAGVQCQNSRCEKSVLGYFDHIFWFILQRFD